MVGDQVKAIAADAKLDGFTDDEIEFMCICVQRFHPDIICEWGTNTGNSARLFYEITRALNNVVPIHSTDICDDIYPQRKQDKRRKRGHHVKGLSVVLHVGDGATRALLEVKRAQAVRPLIFIDDNHDEEETLRDLIRITGGLPHALVLVHDSKGEQTGIGRGYEATAFQAKHEDWYGITWTEMGQGMVALWPRRYPPQGWQ